MGQIPPKFFLPSAPYGASEGTNALNPSQPAAQNPQQPLIPTNPGQQNMLPQNKQSSTINPFFGLFALLLLFAAPAFATTTVTGTIQTLGTANVTSGAFVRFWLRGCAGNQPRVNGTALIGPTQGGVFYVDFAANSSGAISGTLYSTRDATGLLAGDIECGGSKTAVWYGMQAFIAGRGGPEIPVHAKSGSTLDITQVTPITTTPVVTSPTGDGTYLRLDAGNSPLTGNLSSNGTISDAGGTHTGTEAFATTGSPNPAMRPQSSDAIQYVSTNGNDSNDGLSWGTAKLTAPAAYTALPATGGTVLLGATGASCFQFSSGLTFSTNNKPVYIKGEGTDATCLQYTGSSGTALTLDTNSQSIIEDLKLETTVSGATSTGLLVGPTNGCYECRFDRVTVTGFQVDVNAQAYGSIWSHDRIGFCSSAASTIAFESTGSGDDIRISSTELNACATLLYNHNANPIWLSQTIFLNATTIWVNADAGGQFHCNQCHWFNQASGAATNWFSGTNSSVYEINESTFEDAKTSGSVTAFASMNTGTLIFSGNFITHYGGETGTEFLLLTSVAVLPTGFANYISTRSTVPLLYNSGYPLQNRVSLIPTSYSTTSTSAVSSGEGTASITPSLYGEVQINYDLEIANNTTDDGVYVTIYRTTGSIPSAGSAPGGGDAAVVFLGHIEPTANGNLWTSGSVFDTGLSPTTAYKYYLAVNASTGGTATLQAGGLLQITEF